MKLQVFAAALDESKLRARPRPPVPETASKARSRYSLPIQGAAEEQVCEAAPRQFKHLNITAACERISQKAEIYAIKK